MNLALRDIRFNAARFALTAAGVGFLLAAAIGMIGLYRGIAADALVVVEGIGADLWVVQGERKGPFAEASSVASTMDRRAEGVPGVAMARRFAQFSQQFRFGGRELRATVTGLDYPKDDGSWIRLDTGRPLRSSHYEAITDASLGLAVGNSIRLALDDYEVVGVAHGMVDSSGDGLLFVSVNDATTIGQRRTSEEVLLARTGQPDGAAPAGDSSVRQDSKIAAVLVLIAPAADPEAVRAAILRWGDVNVLSGAEQSDLLLHARLQRLRVQILAFTAVLLVVTAIVVSLIIYTMTVEKLHQIAMLKLIGARDSFIYAMIVQQTACIGLASFGLAVAMSRIVFPHFPRRIVVDMLDLSALAATLGAICLLASWFGIRRALQVRAQEVLS